VPSSGSLDVTLGSQLEAPGAGRHRVALTAVTPAGRTYLATWDVRVLADAPPLQASATTPFASASVIVSGTSLPFAHVMVAGQEVEVDGRGRFEAAVQVPPWPTDVRIVATDPVGNVATVVVSAVGLLDYRALPWVPILAAAVGLTGVLYYLRVPRSRLRPEPRQVGDDAVLEEIDPE
jgi:hypothetical protein